MQTDPIIDTNGVKHWYSGGGRHREDGPAVVYPDGVEHWYLHDVRHRDGGPAITRADGSEVWYHYGLRHRTDGPAVIVPNVMVLWFVDNCQITSPAQFQRLTNCTDEELTMMILKYGDIA